MSGGGTYLKDEGSRAQVIVAGGIAGLVSRFCIAPLDVLKIRMQLQIHSLTEPLSIPHRPRRLAPSTLSTFRDILRNEGVTAFWKGNVSAELLYVTYGALQFTTYTTCTTLLASVPPSLNAFIAGATAGATSTAITYPLDLLRTRFAAQGSDKVYFSVLGSIRDIARAEGTRGFFQGLGAGVGQVVPYMGVFFAAYESLRPAFASLELPYGSGDATVGVIASVTGKTTVFPLDVIRKRLQVQGPTRMRFVPRQGYRAVADYAGLGLWGTGKAIVRKEGWRGLYRGLTIGLIKSAPASAVTMWTYERALKVMKEAQKAI